MSMSRLSGFLVQSSLLCTSLIRSWTETSASSSLVLSVDICVRWSTRGDEEGDENYNECSRCRLDDGAVIERVVDCNGRGGYVMAAREAIERQVDARWLLG